LPDIVTHYLASYLVARAALRPRYAALIALIGLLPDIDVLVRVHKWVTHSIPIALLVAVLILVLVYYRFRRYLRFVAIALLIYVLHIALDLFTAPTPALWPLHNSLWIRVELTGAVTVGGVSIAPEIEVVAKPADFTPREVVGGPVVTETGLVLAIAVTTLTILEAILGKVEKR